MSIVRKEENLATAGTLPLLYPPQIVCHREVAHFPFVIPAFTLLKRLRRFTQ